MRITKVLTLVLAIVMALGCFFGCTPATTEEGSNEVAKVDWTAYDKLIADIKAETNLIEREKLMHEAEDMLMETGAIVPLYFYNDIYLMKPSVQGFYATVYGTKYFMYATNGDKDTLKINLASEPDKLDPALNSSVDGACLVANSFAGLCTYDANGAVVNDLAADCVQSKDGLIWTITMKDDLKWSNGDVLNAKDFEYSWKRAAATETAADYGYMFAGIKGYPDALDVTASEDGKTLTVNLAAPCPYFKDLLAFPTFFPVHKASVEGAKGYKDENGDILNPGAWATEDGFVSNGAFILKDWTHNESMTYEKNPNYHNAADVKLSKLEFMLSADDTAIYNAYNDGSIDFADTVPTAQVSKLLNNEEFYIVDNLGTYYVAFNIKSDMFAGFTAEEAAKYRQALGLLIDRQQIVDNVGQTGQQPANTFIPAKMLDGQGGEFKANDDAYTFPDKNSVGYFDPAATKEAYAANVAKAKELLTEIGFKFGDDGLLSAETPIAFEYLTNDGSAHVAIAEIMKENFYALGIEMTIREIEWNTFLNDRKNGNYDVARNGWLADFNDPINMLEMWTSDSGNNDCQFGK